MSNISAQRFLTGLLSAAGIAGLLYYLLRENDDADDSSKRSSRSKKTEAEKLDLDDLDPEERKLLAEVSKKGYYHGRPKSEVTQAPKRIESVEADAASASCSRHEVDEFQKKWDKFDSDRLINKLERQAGQATKTKANKDNKD